MYLPMECAYRNVCQTPMEHVTVFVLRLFRRTGFVGSHLLVSQRCHIKLTDHAQYLLKMLTKVSIIV